MRGMSFLHICLEGGIDRPGRGGEPERWESGYKVGSFL
jgi:hypothetical protein